LEFALTLSATSREQGALPHPGQVNQWLLAFGNHRALAILAPARILMEVFLPEATFIGSA
jgi:hypothetical protein